jgi:hypothetical protein
MCSFVVLQRLLVKRRRRNASVNFLFVPREVQQHQLGYLSDKNIINRPSDQDSKKPTEMVEKFSKEILR